MLTVYHYPRCSTCKKALKWLEAQGVEAKLVDIVASPPPRKVLSEVLKQSGLPVQKLFNTSGELYREGNYKERLANMTEAQALDELAAHGKLIKRPLAVGDGVALVGFREAEYERAFG
jgi:arsenate reductase (glutaredoxin)